MRKAFLALLLAALLCVLCALALAEEPQVTANAQGEAANPQEVAGEAIAVPQKGAAATLAMAQLFSTPQPGAKVLMTYYPGVRVQVVRLAGGEYVQVNVGNRPGTLTGYMRADVLAFTETGIRDVQRVEVTCEMDGEATVYSYMDELSQNMGRMLEHYRVLGVSEDGWLHVDCGMGDTDDETGFVYRGQDASGMRLSLAPYIYTRPTQDEVSYEEAVAFAKEQILADGQFANGTTVPVTLEGMEACEAELEVLYYPNEPLTYVVVFRNSTGGIYTHIEFYVEGKTILWHYYGNGRSVPAPASERGERVAYV